MEINIIETIYYTKYTNALQCLSKLITLSLHISYRYNDSRYAMIKLIYPSSKDISCIKGYILH